MNSGLVDLTYVERFYKAREKLLPTKSSFYKHFTQIHSDKRKAFYDRWKAHFNDRLKPEVIDFYNATFEKMDKGVRQIIPEFRVPENMKERAREILGQRLAVDATLGDLMEFDSFRDQTFSTDIRVPAALSGNIDILSADPNYRALCHMFLHRVQQSEFLYFHETVVSYWINVILDNGVVPTDRSKVLLASREYYSLFAYVMHVFAETLKRPVKELSGLHIADRAQIAAELPPGFQDMIFLSSHVYWYLEVIGTVHKDGIEIGDLLALVYNFLVVPSCEALQADPTVRLRKDAGALTDKVLCELIVREKQGLKRASQVDIVRVLLNFVDTLWVPAKARSRGRKAG